MSPKNRALLIASPYGGLRGPENDVELMAEVLTKYKFEVAKCCGHNATRDQILGAWQQLISESSAEDVVVIYYSGHGGLVKSSQSTSDWQGGSEMPLLSQFLVPMDFDRTTEEDFRGILDIELSYMLRDTTNKTENVTIILDCCHAGRMVRDPHHNNQAWPRNLPEIKHHGVLLSHMERLRREGHLTGDTFVEGNPHAVRIAAAATSETAWGYQGLQDQPIGVLTEALTTAMERAYGQRLSWRTLLLGVCEFVNREFPQQHPRVEGPDTRILFSKEQIKSGALPIRWEDGDVILDGGRVAGVYEGSVYDIMPFGSELVDRETRVAEVRVSYVDGFRALAEVVSGKIPVAGALAFLQKEALPKLFVSFSDDIPALGTRLGQSRFLRCGEAGEKQALIDVKRKGERIVVYKGEMVLASHQFTNATLPTAIDAVVSDGEKLARGHHLLALTGGEKDEKLDHAVEIEFGRVDNGTCVEKFEHDGTANVTENQKVYIKLYNGGNSTVFVTVFDVNVAGTITLVSGSWPKGIELVSGGDYILGKAQFSKGIKGLGLSWPEMVPKVEHVEETLVFILSSEEVSLQHLADPKRSIEARGRMSHLEKITYHLASGQARDLQPESRGLFIRYAVHHIPFSLRTQQALQAEEIVVSTPLTNSDRATYLNNLGNRLSDRYKRTGNADDLDAAISKVEEALTSTPPNYSDRAGYLNNTDPRDDKKRIEKTKGGLLADSYPSKYKIDVRSSLDADTQAPDPPVANQYQLSGEQNDFGTSGHTDADIACACLPGETLAAKSITKHALAEMAEKLPFGWKEVQDQLPDSYKWDIEFVTSHSEGVTKVGCWTCTPLLDGEPERIPLTIAKAPVVLPVEHRWPPVGGVNPPPDPSPSFINPRTELPMDVIRDLFLTFKGALGFYILINGLLQVIVPDTFETAWASSHLPHRFGGLKVCYIINTIEPTALQPHIAVAHSTATTSQAPVFQSTLSSKNNRSTQSLQINDLIEARPCFLTTSREKFAGRIGLKVAKTIQPDQPYLVMSTHVITKAILSKAIFSRNRDPIERLHDDWNKHADIWAGNSKIGVVSKSFDQDAEYYPSGFNHDITLIKPDRGKEALVAGVQNPIDGLGWLSRDTWSVLRQHSAAVKVLGPTGPDKEAQCIKCHTTSEAIVVGEGIFLNQNEAAGTRILESHDESFWRRFVSRALLYRVNPDFSPPEGYSGIAIWADGKREDGTQGPGIVGFQSFIQRSGHTQNFNMPEGLHLERRLRQGLVAFYGAFQVPNELRQDYRIL